MLNTTPWCEAQKVKHDVIVLEPLRIGSDGELLKAMIHAAERIVYVSCNPSTLVRHLRI